MKNDNDSNADLDLNLDDDFDLENSDPDLSFEDSDASPAIGAAQAADDDSFELDELFGDSDEDFNFSKKEDINLAIDDVDSSPEDAETDSGSVDLKDVTESVEDAIGVEIDTEKMAEPVAELVSDAKDVVSDTVDNETNIAAKAISTTAASSGGFLSKILGFFRRKDAEYGVGYSEYDEQQPVEDQPARPFASVADSKDESAEDEGIVADADQLADQMDVESELPEQSIDDTIESEIELTDVQVEAVDDENDADVVDDADLATAITVSPDATVADPSEFDFEEDEAIGLSETNANPVADSVEMHEPAAETVREDLDLDDELDFSDEFDLDADDAGSVSEIPTDTRQHHETEPVGESPLRHAELTPAAEVASQQELEQSRGENELLKSQLESTQANLQEIKDVLDANNLELSELKNLRESLQTELHDLRAERQTLENELQQAKDALTESLEQSSAAVDEVASVAVGAAGGLAVGGADTGSDEQLAELKQQLDKEIQLRLDTELYLEEAEVQRNDVARILRQTRIELNAANESVQESGISDEISQQLDDYAKSVESLAVERDQLRGDLDSTLSEQSQIQAKLDRLEKQHAELEVQFDQSSTKAQQLESSSAEFDTKIEQANGRIAELEREKIELDEKLAASNSELRSSTDSLESLQAELADAREKAHQSDSMAVESQNMRSELELAQTGLADLESKLTENTALLQHRHSELSSLRAELEDAKAVATESEAILAENSQLKSDLENLTAEQNRHELQVTQLEAELQNVNAELQESKQHLKDRSDADGQLSRLRTEFDNAKLEIEKTRQKLEVETAGFQSRLEAEQKLAANRGEEAIRLNSDLDQLKVQLAETQKLLDSERSAKAELAREKSGKAKLASKTTSGDDLTLINGIGPVMQKRLNGLGIKSFEQIANWSAADVKQWEAKLERNTIKKDNWVRQAKKLSS